MNFNSLNWFRLRAESTKTPDSSEDKYTRVVLKVLSSSPSSSRDCFSKLVHCATEADNFEKPMEDAVRLFRELLVGSVSPHSLKILKEERMGQFVEFIEVFTEEFQSIPRFRTFFTHPLDFFADKALIVACCQRLIDQLSDLEEHTSNFPPEHDLQGLRTYLSNSTKIPSCFTPEIAEHIRMIQSYHQLDDRIKDNKPQIDQLRNLEGCLSDLLNQLEDFLYELRENQTVVQADLDPETVINQIRDLQHRLRDIKELAIDLDDPPIPSLQDMCINAVLKGRTYSSPPYVFFSSFVRCSLNCAAKKLVGQGNDYLCHRLRQGCMKNAVDMFYEILRIFPQSDEKRRLGELVKFIEEFRKKFGHDPRLKFSSNPPLDFLANKALIFAWCRRSIDQLRDFKEHASKFSPEENNEGLKAYLLDSRIHLLDREVLEEPSFLREIKKYIKIIEAYQRDDRIKDNKPQIDQLRNLEGRLSDLLSQSQDFIMPWVHETYLDPETVINQIGDIQHRVGGIKELAIDLDGVYPPKEGLGERSLPEGGSVGCRKI